MYKLIICFSFLLGFGAVQAHQPDISSTMLIEHEENKWVLQIRAALIGFEHEIHQHFGKDAYATPEEFRDLVIKHVERNISILFNEDNNIILRNGFVKLGHETSVTFEVEGTPPIIESLKLKNRSFCDIPRNQSALIVLKKGFAKDQFVLNKKNEHTVELQVSETKFVQVNPLHSKNSNAPWILGGISLLLSIIYFVFKNKNARSTEAIPIQNKKYLAISSQIEQAV